MPSRRFVQRVVREASLVIDRAAGAHLWDDRGRRYFDLTSGWNVANAGWNNGEIFEAWRNCADVLPFRPSWCGDRFSVALEEALRDLCPNYVPIAGCSGADAIDNALKVARLVTGRAGVISFAGAYHGSSTGAALATGYEVTHLEVLGCSEQFITVAVDPDNEHLPAVEVIVRSTPNVGAIVVETVATNAGCLTPSAEYLRLLRDLADELGIIFICDEIGTGMGRTGSMFSHSPDLRPHVFTLGKALTNGLYPLSLAMVSKDLAPYISWEHFASTYAGAPLGSAAAVASIRYHINHKLAFRAAVNGVAIRERLLKALGGSKLVQGVHGSGMELSMHFDWESCAQGGLSPHKLIDQLLEREVFATLSADGAQLMIMPPLIAALDDLLAAMDAISEVVTKHG